MYRKLEPQELSLFADAWRAFERWHEAARYALDVYGPTAATVAVDVDYVYDDMSAYFPSISDVTVVSAQGTILEPDFSTAWWKEQLGDSAAPDDMDEASEDQIEDAIQQRRYDLWVQEEATTWTIATPPQVPFGDVYVVDTRAGAA